MMIRTPPPINPNVVFVDRKLNALFCFLLVVVFISAADTPQQWHVILGLLLATAFSFLAFLFRRLTLDGMFSAIVVGIFILGFGGWSIAALVLLFFISSAAISGQWKMKSLDLPESARRSGKQVWANGFWIVISLTAAVIFDAPVFLVGAIGALATATADTWSTELGTRLKGATYLITNFKYVPAGTDGGISIKGTIAALLGSAMIAAASIVVFSLKLGFFISILAAGFLGSVADSYFGATLQRNNRSVTLPISNQQIAIDNNLVNGISTGVGALLAIILKVIII